MEGLRGICWSSIENGAEFVGVEFGFDENCAGGRKFGGGDCMEGE